MTNKEQIIIDGKGCKYKTWDAECSLTGDHHGDNMEPCKFIDEKSCYFKQLARKTQECEELKSQIDADYEDYSQELKTLRNIIENKEKRNARLFVISNNYRKALEEIEKYCNSVSVEENLYNSRHFYNGGVTVEVVNEILNIINKAKGEGNE